MSSPALASRNLQLQNITQHPVPFLRILVMKKDWVDSEEQNTIFFMNPIQESLDAFD